MAEQNKPPTESDLAYRMASMMGVIIDKIQKIVKAQMSTIMRVTDDYPKFLILKWIPQGVEIAFGFTQEGISYKLFEPEGLLEYPTEYQETLANINEAMGEFGFARIREKNTR